MRRLMYLSFDYRVVHKHAIMTTNSLAKRGWKVNLVHNRCAFFEASSAESVVKVPVGNGIGGVKSIWSSGKEMSCLIAKGKPLIVYARQHWLGLLPPLAARKQNIPYVAEFNGLRYWGYWKQGMRVKDLPKAFLISYLERLSARLATALVSPSKMFADRLKELVSNKVPVFVVPNGVDADIFRPIPQLEARRKLGLPVDPLYVVYAGRLEPWQGLDILLHAFAKVASQFPDCRLLVVGGQDEPNKDLYRQLAHELSIMHHALFIPFVPYEQSALYIAAADVCVAPYVSSYCEHGGGSPLKLYAYLSCGRPVVLSDLGEFVDADLVRRSEAGLLVPPSDPEALAEAIGRLLADPELRAEMGRRGREAILNGYTWEHNAERIERVLEAVMRKA